MPLLNPGGRIKFLIIKIFGIILIHSAAFFLYSTAKAQDDEEQKNRPAARINSSMRYMPASNVNAMQGDVRITTAESEYIYEFTAAGKLPVNFFLGSQYIGINNTTEIKLPSKLTSLNAGMETTLPFFQFNNTYLRLRLSPAFYSEDWNIRSSSFRIPLRSFLIYKPTPKWTFIAGIAVYPDFKNETWPIIGFIYKPNDKLTYNLTPKEPNISYKLNQRAVLFTEAGFSNQEFEVTKDNLKSTILEYNETRLAAGVKYKLNKLIQSAFAVGGVFNRSLKYQDNSGKAVIKNSVYAELKIDFTI